MVNILRCPKCNRSSIKQETFPHLVIAGTEFSSIEADFGDNMIHFTIDHEGEFYQYECLDCNLTFLIPERV